MAERGRPKGQWSEKAFKDALRVAVQRNAKGGGTKLMRLADTLVANGLSGDTMAIREIADRLDGKPNQTQDVNINERKTVVFAPKPSENADTWREDFAPRVPAKPH